MLTHPKVCCCGPQNPPVLLRSWGGQKSWRRNYQARMEGSDVEKRIRRRYHPWTSHVGTWKWMVGILLVVSFWGTQPIFRGELLVLGFLREFTLQGTNMSPPKACLSRWVSFSWEMWSFPGAYHELPQLFLVNSLFPLATCFFFRPPLL